MGVVKMWGSGEAVGWLVERLADLGLGEAALESYLYNYQRLYGSVKLGPPGPRGKPTYLWTPEQVSHLEQAIRLSRQHHVKFTEALERTAPNPPPTLEVAPQTPEATQTLATLHNRVRLLEEQLSLLPQISPAQELSDALKSVALAQREEANRLRHDLEQRLTQFTEEANLRIAGIEKSFLSMHRLVLELERYIRRL